MTINIKTTRYYWMKAYTHINGVKMTATDKVVYESLHAFASTTERVSPSVAYLSAINGIGTTAIKDSLKRLEAARLITKQTNGNRANSYELNLAELMKLSEGYREMIQEAQAKEAEAREQRLTNYAAKAIKTIHSVASVKTVETVLRILGMFGINIKQCEKQSEEWGFNTSEASQEALQQDISPYPVKTHSKETKPLKSAPVNNYEYDFDIPKEEFIETFVLEDNSNLKHDPNGW